MILKINSNLSLIQTFPEAAVDAESYPY